MKRLGGVIRSTWTHDNSGVYGTSDDSLNHASQPSPSSTPRPPTDPNGPGQTLETVKHHLKPNPVNHQLDLGMARAHGPRTMPRGNATGNFGAVLLTHRPRMGHGGRS